MLKKLRLKFVCITMTIVTFILIVIFGFVFQFTRQNLISESVDMMESIGSFPFQLGIPNQTPEEVRLPYFLVQIGWNGTLVSFDSGYYDLTDEDFLVEVVSTALASKEQVGVIDQYNLRFCKVETDQVQRIVFSDISSEQHTLANLLRTCLLIGLASFLVFLVVSIFLARWAVKPVEKAWVQQRQFVADASHELKTPLTVILTSTELLQEQDISQEEKQQYTHSIMTMASRMRELVESLLDLARVDNGSEKSQMEKLDMSELVTNAALPFEPVFFERELQLEYEIEPGITLHGIAPRLQQVVEILLDNAVKYSSPAGTVRVVLKKQRMGCLLSVSSQGEPISAEDLKRIFERFYRVDKARTSNHSYGLGLSIAQTIVREHRGKMWAESSSGTNTFYAELPTR